MKYAMFLILTSFNSEAPILSEKIFVYIDQQACEEKLAEISTEDIPQKRIGGKMPFFSLGASYACVPYPNGSD